MHSLTVRQAINTLPPNLRSTGFDHLHRFLAIWEKLRDGFGTYRICDLAGRNESEIPRFCDHAGDYGHWPVDDPRRSTLPADNPLLLSYVLNLGGGAETPDIVHRMLADRLIKHTNEFHTPALELLRIEQGSSVRIAPNRFGANAEPVAPALDLGALPPPHLVAPQLLTGAMTRVVGVEEAAALRYGKDSSAALAAVADAAVATADDLQCTAATAWEGDIADADLLNFIASHAEFRSAASLPPDASSASLAAGVSAPSSATDTAGIPPEPTFVWEYDLLAITSYVLSRFIAGRARLETTVLSSTTVFQASLRV